MLFFSNFFSSISTKEDIENPKIQFGKYSDRNKTSEQLEHWKHSVQLFENQEYLDAFEEFFKYLKDSKIENVKYTRELEQIKFEFFQGSKVIKGYVNKNEISAVSEIVQFEKPNVAVMKRLLTENYFLWFSKFTKKDNVFRLEYYSPIKNAEPESVYFSLQELANEADSFDDILVDEFPFLKPINIGKVEKLSEQELSVKLKFLKQIINQTIKSVESLSVSSFKGAISFSLLNLTYKIYYLFAPEGTLLDELKDIQLLFWTKKDLTDEQKNKKMILELKKIALKSDEEISKSLYKVTSTFPVVKPTDYNKIMKFVKAEIEKIHWYRENKYFDVHQAICEYVVGYCSFSYGMAPVINDLFQVFWKVTNYQYYKELGFLDEFVKKGKLNSHNIVKRINKIISSNRESYPKLVFNIRGLNFSSTHEFASSFLYEFINCDFSQ